jgi:hypothetical protein
MVLDNYGEYMDSQALDYDNHMAILKYQKKLRGFKNFMQTHMNEYFDDILEKQIEDSIIEGLRVPGIPGIWGGIDIPDIPSMNSIFNNIKNSIKSGLVDPVESGFNTALETVKKGVTDTINKVKSTLEGMINDLKKGFDDAMKKVKDWFDDMISKITSGFAVITKFFDDFVKRMKQMGEGLKDIFGGIGTEFTGLGKGLKMGFTNIGILFKWTGEFVFSYITCGVQYIQNLNRCISFYMLDSLGQILYVPIRIILWCMLTFLKRDLYGTVDMLWDKIYLADSYVYGYTGFHFAHYPKNIRDLCYNCKRMKVDALKNKVREINNDFLVKMPSLLNEGVVEMQGGGKKFKGAFE